MYDINIKKFLVTMFAELDESRLKNYIEKKLGLSLGCTFNCETLRLKRT